jgi:ABC-type antimicrobial peptide transport system permease subunit
LVIFLITKHELGFDTFHAEKERIYRLITENQKGVLGAGMLNPIIDPVREEITGLETAAIFYNFNTKVRINNNNEVKYFEDARPGLDPYTIIVTDPAYFDIFRYDWLAGSPDALNAPYMAALTLDKAAKYFGDLPVDQYIGKLLTYGDSLHVSVAGILKPWDKKTDFIFTDFISSASIPGSELRFIINMTAWGMWSNATQVYVKLFPGIETATVEKQLTALGDKYIFRAPNDAPPKFLLQPFADIHFNTQVGEDFHTHRAHLPTLYGLMAIAAFILIIAVCNFINLSTAQSMQRNKEMGVRKILGGKRINLIFQMLGETLLITLFASAFSLALANILIGGFHSFVPQGLTPGLLHPFTWLFLVAVILCTTLLAGLYPAKVLSGASPVAVMKGGSPHRGGSKNVLRQALIVFQFTISLILIICTLVISDQIRYMLNRDLGFTQDAIVNISSFKGNSAVFAEEIKKFPFVEMVSLNSSPPANKRHSGTIFKYNDGGEEREIIGALEFVDEHYIPLYGFNLLAGRNLLQSDHMREFVVNESFARQLGFNDPYDAVGKEVWSGQTDRIRDLQIVGVISDFHALPLYEQIGPMAISATAMAKRMITVKLSIAGQNTKAVKSMLADIEKTWKEINPYERFELTFYDDTIAAFYEKESNTAQIINASMLMAIFISCLGLFGLVVFTTKQRTKEIGIRKVLGAGIFQILALLSGGFVRLVFIAAVIASPVAWYLMDKWLAGFAYHVPVRWWIFVLACLFALLIALATISIQTFKVATENPVNAIKSE